MMKAMFILGLLIITATSCTEQIVEIPDAHFKQALISSNCIDTDGDGKADSDADINNDGQIQISEVQNLTFLDVSAKKIKSLQGIQHFTNLTALDCYKNELKALDISQNKKLEVLFCFDNQIEVLDLSNNTRLIEVGCRGNNIEKLDLSQNRNLKIIYCYKNNLNQLSLKNGNNNNISTMWAFNNPNLKYIEIDNVKMEQPACNRADYSGWCKDTTATYTMEHLNP